MRVAQAVLDFCTHDVTWGARTHEVKVQRADERVATTNVLRELGSRRSLQDEDSAALGECGEEGSQLRRGSSHRRTARTRHAEGPSGRT